MAQALVTLGAVLVAVVCLSAVIVVALAVWRRSPAPEPAASRIPTAATFATGINAVRATLAEEAAAVTEPQLFDRVVRVMTLIFLASVGVFVFVGGEYRDSEAAIQLLLAAGMLAIVALQDLLPAGALGRARYWIEALIAVLFIALLTGLTGGLMSPFVIGFFLIVAGASLSLDDTAPLLLALLASGAYALVGIAVAPLEQLTVTAFVHLAFTVISLSLLAYLASVVGREQRRAREAAISLSRYDPLTGLYNRAYFFSVMDREIRRAARNSSRLAVLMLDLDDLKPVNDTFGHLRGDELLRAVTDAIQRSVRSTDVAARYGGDEFVILLADTEPEGALVVAEKLRGDVSNLAVGPSERPAHTSASIGIAVYPEDGTTMEALISDVDKAMYEAKRRGKNQIVGYVTRTERIASPFSGGRTTMMQRPGRRPDAPPSATPSPGAAPSPVGAQPYLAAQRQMPGPDSSGRGAEPPPNAAPVAPPATVPTGRPNWDSTTPASSGTAMHAGRAEPRAYVAFPIASGQADERPSTEGREARDFTDG